MENRVKIGLRAHDYGKQSASALFEAIARDGWQTMQLAIPKAIQGVDSFTDITHTNISDIKAGLEQSKLEVAVLGVYVEPGLSDDKKRKSHVQHLYNALQQAYDLSAGCVGTETTSRRDESDIRALYRSLEELLPEAERLGVNIGIELVHHHTLGSPELAEQMLKDFASPSLKIIFDPLNLLTLDCIDAQEDMWKRCMNAFGVDIVAIHMKGVINEIDANGMLADAPFSKSIIDYKLLFSYLSKVEAPILREGVNRAEAAADIEFIRGLL